MEGECVVCWQATIHRVVPCGHVVCAACAAQWLERTPTCPVCRSTVVDVLGRPPTGAHELTIRVHVGSHLGVTLTDHAYGVVIQHLLPRNAAHCAGARRGDVVTHMNGIRVRGHGNAIMIAQRASELGYDISCTVLGRRERGWCLIGCVR